jgi:hypothetical protein
MSRAANTTNNAYFRGAHVLPPAERILRWIENSHDTWTLVEMNGDKCAGRQLSKLRWYDRHARQSQSERNGES